MITRDNFIEKLSEIEVKIKALQKTRDKSDNPEGFNALIADLEKKRDNLMKLKI